MQRTPNVFTRLRVGVALGLVPVALVGCGTGAAAPTVAVLATGPERTSTRPASPTSDDPPVERLLAYSRCMRRHGVPTFPDPTPQGNLVIQPSDGIDPASPRFKRAESACKKLGPAGRPGAGMTPAEHARALATLTRYVKCMRKHGIPMADPFTGPGNGVGIALPRNVDPSSPLYEQADDACRHLLPNGGP